MIEPVTLGSMRHLVHIGSIAKRLLDAAPFEQCTFIRNERDVFVLLERLWKDIELELSFALVKEHARRAKANKKARRLI